MSPADRRRIDPDDGSDATRDVSAAWSRRASEPTPPASQSEASIGGVEEDPRIMAAVQEYLAALEAGQRPSRREWLARYPDIAPVLSDYLDSLAFIHSAAGKLAAPTSPSEHALPGAQAAQLLAGKPLGDFQLLREIGRGGMGIVYEADQLSLGRRVAVKVLPLAASLDGRHLQRFKNEAHAAAQLHHTNIVPVYAVGCERSVHFYAMQLIDGRSLSDLIREMRQLAGRPSADALPSRGHAETRSAASASDTPGIDVNPLRAPLAGRSEFSSAVNASPARRFGLDASARASSSGIGAATVNAQTLSPMHTTGGAAFFRAVAKLGHQASEALDYAHQQGVVHRDIKPANLLLDTRGTLWITDFGLAQMYTDAGLTHTGDLVGTLRYMSPEQASGRAVVLDQRTDIYSLGATLYELLTLERAVPGQTREQLLRAIDSDDPRPARSIDRSIPPDLETIICKATAREPTERYPTARAMADDLWRFLQNEPILARPPSLLDKALKWTRRHRSFTLSAMSILLLAAAGLLTSTLLIAAAQAKTEVAYKREQQKAVEANEQRALADRQRILADEERSRADKSNQRAREVVDLFTELATEDLASKPELADLRKMLLETSLVYYQELIDDRKEDPSASAALAESRRRATSILQDLTGFDDLFRVTSRSELLSQPAVREDLKLAAGKAREDGTGEFVRDSWKTLLEGRDLGRMAPDERRACLAEVAAKVEMKLNRVLTMEQTARLKQIYLQSRGVAAFSDPSVLETLAITREQRSKIRAIQTRSRDVDHRRFPGRPTDLPQPPDDSLRSIVALLTPLQVQMWKELIGRPFDRGQPGGGPRRIPGRDDRPRPSTPPQMPTLPEATPS